MTNKERIQAHNAELRDIIDIAETLPDAGEGGTPTPVATSLIRSGLGYIDTGIDAANSNLTIQAQYEFEKTPTGYWYLIRAYAAEAINSTRILYNGTSSTYCCLNSLPSSSLSITQKRYAGVVYTDVLKPESNNSFSYTTNGVKTTKTRTSGEELVGQNILLFSDATSNDNTIVKVYYLKIYDGDALVRDFIPFVTQDGEYGLYDKVTNQFYGNAGSGTFEAETMEVGGGSFEGEPFEGEYIVTPKVEAQTMSTKNKVMLDDVTIEAIPYAEVKNLSNGKTVTIG